MKTVTADTGLNGWNGETMTPPDNLHPNNLGMDHMADQISRALSASGSGAKLTYSRAAETIPIQQIRLALAEAGVVIDSTTA